MPKELTLPFCSLKIYDNYMVVIMNKGVHISVEYNEVLQGLAEQYFRNKPFVYLTWRKNSYSVDPAIYKHTASIKNLVAFGVVAEIPVSKANATVEKHFMPKPFEIFDTLADAQSWAVDQIRQHESEIKKGTQGKN